jgi:aryl-alcohol dehydrogenase-like predicted oxidoreductase
MQTKQLGSQGPDLSVVGFGAWEAGGTNWGPNESDDAVIAAMRAAIDAGINWIDTAEVYGKGVSESLVGRAIAGRRDEVLIASKVAPHPEGTGFRPEQVHRACEASMARMDIDVIDLFQLHWPDDQGVPLEDTWGAMVELQEAGRVKWIGVSNFTKDMIERCLAIHHVDSLQQEFSMLNRSDADLIRWCGEQGVGVVSYGPLAFGLLTGTITADTVFPEGDWRGSDEENEDEDDVDLFSAEHLPGVLDTIERLRPIADRLGISLAQLALAWNVNQSGVTSAIAGSRNPDHVRTNAEAGDVKLEDTTLAEIGAVLG